MSKFSIISASIYLGIALLVSGMFVLGTLTGDFTIIERIGGAIWVFILSTIILMPIVIPRLKRRFGP